MLYCYSLDCDRPPTYYVWLRCGLDRAAVRHGSEAGVLAGRWKRKEEGFYDVVPDFKFVTDEKAGL